MSFPKLKLPGKLTLFSECHTGKWCGVFTESNASAPATSKDAVQHELKMDLPQQQEYNMWGNLSPQERVTLKITYKLKVTERGQILNQKNATPALEMISPYFKHLINKRNCDVNIKCGEETFEVHKLLLTCKYFVLYNLHVSFI